MGSMRGVEPIFVLWDGNHVWMVGKSIPPFAEETPPVSMNYVNPTPFPFPL
jgi:hypothetical protein